MRGWYAVDGEFLAGELREMEEAADVVILVKGREEMFGFRRGELERVERGRLAEFGDKRTVAVDELVERHWVAASGDDTKWGF
jgi:hypothetical protein